MIEELAQLDESLLGSLRKDWIDTRSFFGPSYFIDEIDGQ